MEREKWAEEDRKRKVEREASEAAAVAEHERLHAEKMAVLPEPPWKKPGYNASEALAALRARVRAGGK